MYKRSIYVLKHLKRIIYPAILILLLNTNGNSQSFSLLAVSDMHRVFEDGYRLPATYDTVKVFGIKGEIISGQVLIIAEKKLSDVTIEMSQPVNISSGTSIPQEAVIWNFVGSVPLKTNAPNQPASAVIRPAPASFPDYLMQEKLITINEKSYKSVWLTISIPVEAEPGKYFSDITVKTLQGSRSLPLMITVYPLTMPAGRHLKVTEWYTTGKFEKFHGITQEFSSEWFDMLRKYAVNMAEHRQNVFEVPMSLIRISESNEKTYDFDFSMFDKVAQVFWDTGCMDYLETGELTKFGEGGFSSSSILFKDFPVHRKETDQTIAVNGREIIPYLLPAFEDHLRKKGWLEKTLFHIKDEPSHHNALSWIEASSIIHKYAPDLKRIDAVCTSFLFGNIEIAVPKLDHLDAGYKIYRKEQDNGNELWFYTVGIYQGSIYPNKTIDMPLIDNRLLHWINYKYDLTGYLHWGWNQWTDDPYTDPDIHTGDGWHVYPVKEGILNSLRWEQMRNGIQDYEYFWMLEKEISEMKDSLGSRFSWISPAQRGKEIAARVIMGMKEHSDDPVVLNNAKRDLIREILSLKKSPALYVQTNPPEHGTIINRSVVELLGWTEPGTEIIVNGSRLPVSKEGLFMERFLIFKGGRLEIRAKNTKGEKLLIRDYNVTY